MLNEESLKWLTNSPWWAIATALVFLVLAVWGIILTLTTSSRKSLCYGLRTNSLLRDVNHSTIPGVSITFEGYSKEKVIENLSVTKCIFWNAGNQGFKRTDVREP